MSVELNWPFTVSAVSSCTAPASLPVAKLSTGASLLPVRVIVTFLVTVAPKSSVSVTVNTSVLVWPSARYCAALLFSV
ncbi:hypothetical protein D3C81_1015680 [compost metagenome]